VLPANELAHCVRSMPFAVLSCNTDIKSAIGNKVTQATVNTHINEYKHVQAFIDEYHTITDYALSEDVVVDKWVGCRGNGMYHEPLEQVFVYLGLSMTKNQTVSYSMSLFSILLLLPLLPLLPFRYHSLH
jgi:hypothetical protein